MKRRGSDFLWRGWTDSCAADGGRPFSHPSSWVLMQKNNSNEFQTLPIWIYIMKIEKLMLVANCVREFPVETQLVIYQLMRVVQQLNKIFAPCPFISWSSLTRPDVYLSSLLSGRVFQVLLDRWTNSYYLLNDVSCLINLLKFGWVFFYRTLHTLLVFDEVFL